MSGAFDIRSLFRSHAKKFENEVEILKKRLRSAQACSQYWELKSAEMSDQRRALEIELNDVKKELEEIKAISPYTSLKAFVNAWTLKHGASKCAVEVATETWHKIQELNDGPQP